MLQQFLNRKNIIFFGISAFIGIVIGVIGKYVCYACVFGSAINFIANLPTVIRWLFIQ